MVSFKKGLRKEVDIIARPTKSATARTGHMTKEEIRNRQEQEQQLRGQTDKLKPSSHLNARQKKIFNYIVDQLEAANILGNLDIYIMDQTAIAIERLQQIEKQINDNINCLLDKNLMSAKDKYTKEFFRCCNELSLSPQSRAKLGNVKIEKEKEQADPLLKALKRVK